MAELENEKPKEEIRGSEGSSPQSLGTQPEWKQGYENLKSQVDVITKAMSAYTEDRKKIIGEDAELKKIRNQIKNLNNEIVKTKKTVQQSELRSIEIIGIISAIIALVLVFVDTSNKLTDVKNAYVVLVTGTSSLVLFSVLLHHFFNRDDKRGKWYYVLFFGIPLLIIIGLGIYVLFVKK